MLQFTPTPVFEKFLFDKGANRNRDCPFKVAFGESYPKGYQARLGGFLRI